MDYIWYSRASRVAHMVENPPAMQEPWFNPWVGEIPWRKDWQPTPVFLPGEFHGQRSLVHGQRAIVHGIWYSNLWLINFHLQDKGPEARSIACGRHETAKQTSSHRPFRTLALTCHQHVQKSWRILSEPWIDGLQFKAHTYASEYPYKYSQQVSLGLMVKNLLFRILTRQNRP